MAEFRRVIRGLAQAPGFTAAALVTLTLGIAVNTAIFSVVNVALLQRLPFQSPESLVSVWKTRPGDRAGRGLFTRSELEFLQQSRQVFESIEGFEPVSVQLTLGSEPEVISGVRVTPGLADTIGAVLHLGRPFGAEEENGALISHSLWRDRFGSDPGVLGRTVVADIGGTYAATQPAPGAFTVIGVLRPEMLLPSGAPSGVWISGTRRPDIAAQQPATLFLIGRLRAGLKAEAAHGLINGAPGAVEWNVSVVPVAETLRGTMRAMLLLLWGAAGLVLLIACANVANLQLVRWAQRQKDLAIHTALGASRLRLARQLLLESATVAIAGSACGLIAGFWCVRVIGVTDVLPRMEEPRLDAVVLAYAAGLSMLTAVLFASAPAWTLRGVSYRSLTERTGQQRYSTRRWLVVSEVALAVMLLTGAGLLLRSFARLNAVDPGFRPEHVVTARISLPVSRYPQRAHQTTFYRDVLERLRTVPGVEAAAAVNFLPLGGADSGIAFTVDGRPPAAPSEQPTASFRAISPGYFRVMGIRVLQGRDLGEPDLQRVSVLVNEALATRWWPNESPVGQRLRLGPAGTGGSTLPVVGVVANVRQFGLDADERPTLYLPFLGQPVMTLVVRGHIDARVLASVVQSIDKQQPIQDVRTMAQMLDSTTAQPRLRVRVLSLLAVLALALAALGVFVVTAYAVGQRTREIGIRMAVGAAPRAVWRMVVLEGFRQAAFGIAIGLVCAWALKSVLAHWLFGISASDPMTFLTVSLITLAAAAIAVYLPAHRAMTVAPAVALRSE